MFDADIRQALKPEILARLPGSALFDEMSLHRTARADVAAVHDALWGYEIKGPRDSLSRLPLQIPYYERVFDRITLVISEAHLARATEAVPRSWGLWAITGKVGAIEFEEVRPARLNRATEIGSVIRLLWKDEAIRVARRLGKPVRRNMLVWYLWEHLATLPVGPLKAAIRDELQRRVDRTVVASSG